MPSISLKNVAAGTANALDGLNFQQIEEPGALVTLYATTPTAGASLDYSIGGEFFGRLMEANIEAAADVVDTERDKLMDREAVPAGKQFVAVNAQIANILVVIEPLPLG